MRLVNRTALIIKPKQPYIDWANSFEDGGPEYDQAEPIEHNIYLVEDVSDDHVDVETIVRPYYRDIFEEELAGWDQLEENWPSNRGFDIFLNWFEVEVYSMILDLINKQLRSEPYD